MSKKKLLVQWARSYESIKVKKIEPYRISAIPLRKSTRFFFLFTLYCFPDPLSSTRPQLLFQKTKSRSNHILALIIISMLVHSIRQILDLRQLSISQHAGPHTEAQNTFASSSPKCVHTLISACTIRYCRVLGLF